QRTTDLQQYLTIAGALAQWGDAGAVKELNRAQKAKDPAIRLQVLAMLTQLGQGQNKQAGKKRTKLLAAARGWPPETTMAAFGPLAKGGDSEAQQRLRDLTESPTAPPPIRAAAAAALVRAGDGGMRARMQQLAQVPGPAQAAMARALAELG